MTKPRYSYVRTHAASCLGLTPHSTTDEIAAALCAQLDLTNATDIYDRDPALEDPAPGRKVAAGQLLLTAPDHVLHTRKVLAFCDADARMPEHLRVFQLKKEPASDGEQLTLIG